MKQEIDHINQLISQTQYGEAFILIQTYWEMPFEIAQLKEKFKQGYIDQNFNGQFRVAFHDLVMRNTPTRTQQIESRLTETVQGVTFAMIKIPEQNYYIAETPVTQALWQAVMGNNPSTFPNKPQNPVEQVSWQDAQVFLTALQKFTGKAYRLPTETEWEYSALGNEPYQYAGSNAIGEVAWYSENSYDKGEDHPDYGTHPVKQLKPNAYGLYDMNGNVWEWCENCQNENQEVRAMRGGSWNDYANSCTCLYRTFDEPLQKYGNLGFRLAL